jgi:hypothetical protein
MVVVVDRDGPSCVQKGFGSEHVNDFELGQVHVVSE